MKEKYNTKTAYLAASIIISLLLLLQFILLTVNNINEAKSTTYAYVVHLETIIEKNRDKEEVLVASLKDDYIVLAKAVSYYLDHYPDTAYGAEELQKICSLMSIDEINVFDENGTIISSTQPDYVGYSFDSGEQISYFTPMLSDRSLTMCQDITPNTAVGKPMIYAITWNESGTQMVQVGIEPVRLLNELESNNIQATVEGIALDEDMDLVVAEASTHEIVGSKDKSYLAKQLSEITDCKTESGKTSFSVRTSLAGRSGYYYCSTDYTEDYCICAFLNHRSFAVRTAQSIFIVFIYLLVAFFVIMIIVRRLITTRKENYEHMQIFESMSEIYYSLHLLDLKKNTAVEYSSKNQVKDVFNNTETQKANVIMTGIMKATMSDEYLQRGLEFTDLTTLAERMRNKKIISMELLGKNVGWIRMSFITIEAEDGLPVKAVVATQIIDEEKKTAESLYKKSHIDELTGCYNRRAYNSDVLAYQDSPEERDFAYISFDVNNLKTVNDTLGHEAGDELINGVAECMKHVFSKHGKIYRLGGDEFTGLLRADGDLMKMLCDEFDRQISSWHGKLVGSLSVSYAYVLSTEAKGKSMNEIAGIADRKMYEAKAKYYSQKGIDRRRR